MVRQLTSIALLLLLLPWLFIAGILCSQIPAVYYAHFRSIEGRLLRISGLTIVDSWKHEDVVLEDFGFVLKVRDCPAVRLDFYESHEWYGLFERVEGVVVCPANCRDAKIIPAERLKRSGLSVRTLPEVLAHLGEILKVSDRTSANGSWPGPVGNWVVIRYPLKAGSR